MEKSQSLPLRALFRRVEDILIRGLRLNVACAPDAIAELGGLANELDSVADQIRGGLAVAARIR